MKITEPGRSQGISSRREVRRAGGSDFRIPAARSGEGSAVPPAAPLAIPGAVLSLQEVDDAPEQRRRAVERGHDVLDELEKLRLAVVEGRASEGALRRLASLLGTGAYEVADDRLAGVLREIEVRAAVEVARREIDDGS